MAPQLQSVRAVEQQVVGRLSDDSALSASEAAASAALRALFVRRGDTYEMAFARSSSLPRFYEAAAHHWGATLDDSSTVGVCPLCCLPLRAPAVANPLVAGGGSNADANVVVFAHCQHAQHERCAQRQSGTSVTAPASLACAVCVAQQTRLELPTTRSLVASLLSHFDA